MDLALPATGMNVVAALHELEQRFVALFGVHPDALLVLDRAFRLTLVNPALERITELAEAELVGTALPELFLAEERPRVLRHLQRVLRGDVQSFEASGIDAGGVEFTVSVLLLPLYVDGRIDGIYGLGRDMTLQREAERAVTESEARYRLLADSVHDMISLHDLEGTILYASPSAVEILGLHPVELIGRSMYDLIEPEDVPVLRAAHEAILRRQGRFPAQFRLRREGATQWYESTGRVVLQDGEPWRIAAVTRDITERRSLEQQAMQTQKMEALGRLAGGIAHDFNNVLTVIAGEAELLTERLAEGTSERDKADQIRSAARRAAGLTARLLSFSRGDARRPEPVDVNEVILEVHPLLTRLLSASVRIVTELEPALRAVYADATALEQVVMNLALNANEAMSGSGGVLTIESRNVRVRAADPVAVEPGEYVELAVHDTGRGMDAATAARAFEPFFTTSPSGTGLGLPTVYAVVKQAGGDVTIDSRPGLGTTVRLLLPALAADVSAAPRQHTASSQTLEGTETLLVAEDDSSVRLLVVATLQRYGYRVMSAVDGLQALDLFRTYGHMIDAVIADVNMPEMHGDEMMRLAAADGARLPVLYISGLSAGALQLRNDGGATAFLPKPFTPTQLAGAVRRLLDD